jgi:beta-glucosidase
VYNHTTSHEPDNQHKRYWDEESSPLFPFGFGLSYGRFDYTDLELDRLTLAAGESLSASVTVSNTSDRDADEVVQLYLHQRHGSASRPVRELKGFRRVHLSAGSSETVTFTVGPDQLRYWNAAVRDHVVEASTYDLWVGGDSSATIATTFVVTDA